MSPHTPDSPAVTASPPNEPGGDTGFQWPADRREPVAPTPSREPRDWQDWFRIALITTGVLAALVTYLAPAPDGLTPAGKGLESVIMAPRSA